MSPNDRRFSVAEVFVEEWNTYTVHGEKGRERGNVRMGMFDGFQIRLYVHGDVLWVWFDSGHCNGLLG